MIDSILDMPLFNPIEINLFSVKILNFEQPPYLTWIKLKLYKFYQTEAQIQSFTQTPPKYKYINLTKTQKYSKIKIQKETKFRQRLQAIQKWYMEKWGFSEPPI